MIAAGNKQAGWVKNECKLSRWRFIDRHLGLSDRSNLTGLCPETGDNLPEDNNAKHRCGNKQRLTENCQHFSPFLNATLQASTAR